jgi:hypothetical protein
MRFARGDMRDHIVSHKSDYGTSYRRCGVLQRQSRLKISFCEIFGVGRFPTFATISAISEHTQLDCGPDPTSPALRASSASFVKIFFPAMRPDSQAPVI